MAKHVAAWVLLLPALGYSRYQVSVDEAKLDQTQAQLTEAQTEAKVAKAATVALGNACQSRLTRMADLLTQAQTDLQQTRAEVVQISTTAAQANASAAQANATATATAHPLLSLVSRMVGAR